MERPRGLAVCMLSLALVAALHLPAVGAAAVENGGFDDLYLGDSTVMYALPDVPGWTFTANGGEAGILGVNATGLWGVPADGQCAAIYGGGTVSQAIADFVAGTTQFNFDVQGYARPEYGGPLTVKLDGVALTFGGVATVAPASGPMVQYTSDPITVSAGSHTLEFVAGDWAFIDDVGVTNVPEPTCFALLACGLIGALMRTRKS